MSFLSNVGLATVLFVVAYVAKLIYHTFFYKCDLNQFQSKQKDAYALVTGCTSGIGEGFAYVLAKRGFNLLLVSRSESKLQALSKAIQAKHPSCRISIAVSDAAVPANDGIDRVVAAARNLNLALLINNVGISSEHPEIFENNDEAIIEQMITVNCRYSALLTQKLIPFLRASKSGRAAIINLSSLSAYLHVPYLAIYSATKAFNLAFSNALREELLMSSNIQVVAITPGFVVSEMTKIPRTSLGVCSAEVCATSALNAIGLRAHAGYWYHALYTKAVLLVPAAVRGYLACSQMQKMSEAKQRRAKLAAEGKKVE